LQILFLNFLFFSIFWFPQNLAVAQVHGSRSGDESALEALYASANGSNWNNRSGWSSSGMSLADDIYGVTVETIDGELRVTEIDLRANNLTGNVEFSEWSNLTELTLLNLTFNSLTSRIPVSLFTPDMKIEYLYLSISDETEDVRNGGQPHEEAYSDLVGPKYLHPGKTKGSEKNVWTGPIPPEIENLDGTLKWFILNWSDDWSGHVGINNSPNRINGITKVPIELFNIQSLVGLQVYENWNIAGSGNSITIPPAIGNMRALVNIQMGGGSGTAWDEDQQGWIVGDFPAEMANLTEVRHFNFSRQGGITSFPDLSGLKDLKSLMLNFTGAMNGRHFPEWLIDGRFPRLDMVDLSWPNNGDGFIGALPDFGSMPGLDLFNLANHQLSGHIPKSFFKTNPNGIKKTDLRYNYFTSLENQDLTNLSNARDLEWPHNKVKGKWPYLDWGGGARTVEFVRLSDNKYVFSDMLYVPPNALNGETVFELYNSMSLRAFDYAPQKPFGSAASRSYSSGSNITLDDFDGVVTHPDNRYQWLKDGAEISGATSRELTITDARSSDSGTYRLIVTNPGVSGLTLNSKEITINIEEKG